MYVITAKLTIAYAPDGAQSLTVPSAQSMEASVDLAGGNASQTFVLVPGGNAPTTSNINTGVTAAAALLSTYLQGQIGVIQGWASGGD
jgi:hypothetical protein